jgi:NADPH2:quinone reductase
MKAIRAHRHGGPEVLQLDELPTPEPGPGQALVRVEAAGVNYIDTYHRTGLYPMPLPVPLGLEGAGVVEALGPDVPAGDAPGAVAPGARVAWSGVPGSYATHVLAPADRLVPLPAGVSPVQGAAAMLQGMTAHYLSQTIHRLAADDACLIHAAAGGVGLLLCQLARRAGARAFATVSTEAKAAAAREAGATDVIRYDQADFAAEVLRATGDRGVQVVYDGVGRTTFAGSLRCLATRGILILFGQSSGTVPPIDPAQLASRSLFLTRPVLGHYTATHAELLARAADILGWIERGDLRVTIDRELPLAAAREAHELLEGRKTSGKLLLRP